LSSRDEKFAYRDSRADVQRTRFIRSALLVAYAQAARSLGLDPFRMLRKAGLPVGALDHPDYRISAERVGILIEDSAKAADCEDFGLIVGRSFKLSMKGPLGLLMREQPTVRQAVEALKRYLRYQNDYVEIRTELHAAGLWFSPVLLGGRGRAERHMVELTLAMYVQSLRALLGDEWKPQAIAFAHHPPKDLGPYIRALGPVEFEAGSMGLLLTEADLATPIPDADPDMAHEIARFIEAGAVPGAPASMSETISDLILRLLPSGHCSVEQVAQHLGVDRRTVHRRLSAEGQSFTGLLESARRELATEQLKHGDAPLTVVTSRLGFSSLSTFSRWFRQTYGIQPSEFRRLAHDV
jgi:AraC-like DNA-binding protein